MLDNIFYEKSNVINIPTSVIYNNPLYIKRLLSRFDIVKDSAISEGNYEVYDICLDIEFALKKIKISDRQKERLAMWQEGYKEYEIANALGVSRIAVHRSVVIVCKKISNTLINGGIHK